MEAWRRAFREVAVRAVGVAPQGPGLPTLKEMTTFAEAVAEDVGPHLARSGVKNAHLYAAQRCAYLIAVTFDLMAAEALGESLEAPTGATAKRVDLLRSEPRFLAAMQRHIGLLATPNTLAAIRLLGTIIPPR